MGSTVCAAIQEAPDLDLVCAVDHAGAGRELSEVVEGPVPALGIAGSLEALSAAQTEVVVEFALAANVEERLRWYADNGLHAVIGTTGIAPKTLEMARSLFGSGANAVVAANFSIGAALLVRFCESAAKWMDGVEIVELHHDAKRDAPSGTALHTAERIAIAREAQGLEPFPPDATELVSLEGSRGAQGPGGVRIHSVRLPGLVAHEEVTFGAAGQVLSIRHDSLDRRSFMPGVLLAVRTVSARPGLTQGLGALLETSS